ncbi:MAG: FUSC family protein [Streptosporangiales bacterium]
MRSVAARVGTWLAASDPGRQRLRLALRAVTALVGSVAVAAVIALATGQSPFGAVLGGVVGMIGAIAVNEQTRTRQALVTAVTLPSAAATETVGTVLSGHVAIADAAFVAVLFAAVYARRFGPWGNACGTVAFPTYFFVIFLKATPAQLPWLIAATAIGVAMSILVRTVVFPDRPEATLRHSVRSLYARLQAVVDEVEDAVDAGQVDERARGRLDTRLSRLGETSLMIADQLDDAGASAVPAGVDSDELAVRVLDAQLAAERLVASAQRALEEGSVPADVRRQVSRALTALRAVLYPGASGAVLHAAAEAADELAETTAERPEDRVLKATARRVIITSRRVHALAVAPLEVAGTPLGYAEHEAPATGDEAQDADDEGSEPEESEADEPQETGLQRPSTRQAIQVAIAAALAVVVGELISPIRWYWAVIATFVMFTGTSTRGEILSKGWQRTLGTVAGVLGGVLVAAPVTGHQALAIVLILVCVFAAFYMIMIAYALMAFWITMMLALLYGLLGQFSLGLLGLRVAETAVGAAIGALVGYLVLPKSTSRAVTDGVDGFLDKLAAVVTHSVDALCGERTVVGLGSATRGLTSSWQSLRTSAKPLSRGVAGIGVRHRSSLQETLRIMGACDHYGRRLAAHTRAAGANPEWAQAVRPAADAVVANLGALRERVTGERSELEFEATEDLLDAAESEVVRRDWPAAEPYEDLAGAVRALRRVDQSIRGLVDNLHLHPFHDRAGRSRAPEDRVA